MIGRNRIIGCVASLAVPLSAGLVFGSDVTAGYDLWSTPPNGAVEDFGGTGAPPIPADFFGPGSDPFVGVVNFVGEPLGTYLGQPTGPADTIVQRPGDASLPIVPSSDTIPIQIVALSLVSVDPIVVTFNGGQNPTQFDVAVTLGNQPSTGSMTITHSTTEGGTYDATINVCPLFTFTEVGNPGNQHILDFCDVLGPPQVIAVAGQPWCHVAVSPQVSPLSGPNFFVKGTTNHSGPHPIADPIETAAGPAIPTVSHWGLIVLSLLLVTAGTIVFRRQRARLAAA